MLLLLLLSPLLRATATGNYIATVAVTVAVAVTVTVTVAVAVAVAVTVTREFKKLLRRRRRQRRLKNDFLFYLRISRSFTLFITVQAIAKLNLGQPS